MKKYQGIIVVEGNTDEAFLKSFIDSEIVKTNGSCVTRETINYLKEVSKHREIIVLTDPDFPGKQIRDKLNNEIPNLKHAFIPKEKSIKNGKVGVAESSKDVILEALNNVLVNEDLPSGKLTISDLVEIGIIGNDNSQEKRNILERKIHIGHANGKTVLKRLNSLNISKQELEEILNESR